MSQTLAEHLKPVSVDWSTLHNQYNPLLSLVRELIGIIPNCDTLLEIWPPGFRTYNLLVPNFFNLPKTLFGSKSFKASMGLAMYASSKAACAYCTSHACSFALRRGLRSEAISGARTEKEQAVVTLAEKLSNIPSTLTMSDVEAVNKHFTPSEVEWLVNSISMMGFLNKFMNALGVELEQDAIDDTADLLSQTGWKPGIHALHGYGTTRKSNANRDNIFTYLRVIRHAPGALIWENKCIRNVPTDYRRASEFLQLQTGYSFPILKPVKAARIIRTLTTALRDNLDRRVSAMGVKMKMYAGYVFGLVVQNELLQSEMQAASVTLAPELSFEKFRQLKEFAQIEIPSERIAGEELMTSLQQQLSLTRKEAALLFLSMAASESPSSINDVVIETTSKLIEPAEVIEMIVWLSLLQLLNRLSSYYTLIKAY
jgi:alkylhydroperoxidase family enzyme